MPSFTIHLAVAKKYLEKHPEEKKEEFYRGVIDPDLKDKRVSHFGPNSSSPDLNRYCQEMGLKSSYNRGYFLHLLTDDLFYNKYLESFSEEIYDDYDRINKILIEKYQLTIPEIIREKVKFKDEIPQILDFESICKFIDTVGEIDLENYKTEREGQEIG